MHEGQRYARYSSICLLSNINLFKVRKPDSFASLREQCSKLINGGLSTFIFSFPYIMSLNLPWHSRDDIESRNCSNELSKLRYSSHTEVRGEAGWLDSS